MADWPAADGAQVAHIGRADQLHPSHAAGWDGEADASASIRMGVDAQFLYLAASVQDDHLAHAGQPWWHGDSIELFLDLSTPAGAAPPSAYRSGCWQIIFMPTSPQLAWGVIYRGTQVVFNAGGLRGVKVAHRRRPAGGYDLEAALPLAGLGLSQQSDREVGFALALTDADEEPLRQEAYLSWNGGIDLYQRPDRFGRLVLPPVPPPPSGLPGRGGAGPPPTLVALLFAIVAALLLAGPGARRLARIGPGPKAVALGLTGLLALGLHLRGTQQVDAAHATLEARMDGAAAALAPVAAQAAELGALDDADGAERARRLTRLLLGERLPCTPRLDEVALVPLLPQGAPPSSSGSAAAASALASSSGAADYAIPLDQPQRFPLVHPLRAEALTLRATLEMRAERREQPRPLGTLRALGSDGTAVELALEVPGGAGAGSGLAARLSLSPGVVWHTLEWTPDGEAARATLLGIDAHHSGGRVEPLALSGLSEDGIPILAHARGPQHARVAEPGTTLVVDLPALREADRLWLVLAAERAYPTLPGDDLLGTVEIEYSEGEPSRRELRNGLDLTLERLPAGLARPAGMRSRVAYRWADGSGVINAHALVAVRVDPRGQARRLTLRNLGVGGRLTLHAATLARTRSTISGGPLAVTSIEDATERVELAPGSTPWRDFLGRRGDLPVTLRVQAATGATRTALTLAAPTPPAAQDARRRTDVALLTCLALGVLLIVLLAVDALERARRLAWRLALGVLAAALVPLSATIWLVERAAVERAEAEQVAAARAALEVAQETLRGALRRTQEAARQLAGELAGDVALGDAAQLDRLVRVVLAGALPEGRAGLALAGGSEFSASRVSSEVPGRALLGPSFVAEHAERPGFLDSPWDGLLLVGSSRAGRGARWARVTLGVRMDDQALAQDVHAALADPQASLAVLGADGTPLAAAGPGGPALARSLLAAAPQVARALETQATVVRSHLAAAQDGDGEHTALVRSLAPGLWLALGIDRARLESAIAAEHERLVWLGLFALVLVVTVTSLVARRVSGPIRALVRVTESVRRGDFSVQAQPRSGDEVGDLTVAFDQMRVDLKGRIEDAEFLGRAQDRLAASLDLAHRARVLLELVQERFEPDVAVLVGASDARGPVHVLAERGRATAYADRPFAIAPDGWLRAALEAASPLTVDGQDDPRAARELPAGSRLVEERVAWLAAPLRAGEELQGLLVLAYGDRERLPGGERARLLAPLAAIGGVALSAGRLYRLAALDEVTRLPGATAFEAGLKSDVQRALSGGPELWLVRIGLDHVDHVTLRRGVEAGRDLLRAAADALRAVTGGRSLIGRLREGELAARLPGARREEALALAEQVRARIAALEVVPESGGEPLATTASVGLARLPGDAQSPEFLLHAAERALAKARSDGGDRVQAADAVESGVVDLPPFEEGAIFRSANMVRVVEAARRAARSDASVLITGETGTGKEVIAQLLHRRSLRADKPFVTVNCAAFPETLLESELFGYERGAFTGAERRREGRFEVADRGTLFLDEVGEMSEGAQVKLLRVLQEKQFTRLGGNRPVAVDVRILAATNRDLESAVREGRFREDLYYRLNVIRLAVPALRERREEIPPLVAHFLKEFRRRNGRGPDGFTPATMDVLYRHPWPGNVRELRNVIERCAVLCEADQVAPEHLQLDAGREAASGLAPRAAPRDDLSERQRRLLDHLALHGRCTNREYQELSGTSARTGLRDLQELIDRGLILREGRRRGATYRLA